MSFNIYTNLNGVAGGKTTATLYTNSPGMPGLMKDQLVGKSISMNGVFCGKVISNTFTPVGTPINKVNPPEVVVTDQPLMAIKMLTGFETTAAITDIGVADAIYLFGAVPVSGNEVWIYTNDQDYITAAENSLIDDAVFINGQSQPIGVITGNALYNGNAVHTPLNLLFNDTDLVSYPFKDLILMGLKVRLVNTPAHTINGLNLRPNVPGEFYFSANTNLPGAKFNAGEYAVLYRTGGVATDGTQLATQNFKMHSPISTGNLGLYINDQFIGPIVDLRTGFSYQDPTTPGQVLPASPEVNPWPLERYVGYYEISQLHAPINFTEQVNKVAFKPYYKISYNATTRIFRIAAASGPLVGLVGGYAPGDDLYIDGQKVGAITGHGTYPLYIDGRGPINFSGYTGNAGSPALTEYYFEVANPLIVPVADQSVVVRLDDSYIPGPQGTAHTVVNLPTIIGSLVGKRLIINGNYIGLISTNTADSITAFANVDVPREGIWQLYTTDNIGRAPLCVASQISLCEWPEYAHLDSKGLVYDKDYAYNPSQFKAYPNGTAVYTRDDLVELGTVSEQYAGHVLPEWVERAELDPTTHTFQLAGEADVNITDPVIVKYVHRISTIPQLQLSRMWQLGKVVHLPYDVIKNQGPESTYPLSQNGAWAYQNIPGHLVNIRSTEPMEAPDKLYNHFTLAPVRYIVPAGGLLDPFTVVKKPVGYTISGADGKLVAGTVISTPSEPVVADADGLLPPGINVKTKTGLATVLPDGTLPNGTKVITTLGALTTAGALPVGTVVILEDDTVTVLPDGTLPLATTVIIPVTYVVPPSQLLPAGMSFETPTGLVTVAPDGTIPTGTTVVVPDGTSNAPLATGVVLIVVPTPPTLGTKRLLCAGSLIEFATAPNAVYTECCVVEMLTPGTISVECSVIEKLGVELQTDTDADYLLIVSMIESIAKNIDLTSNVNKIISPSITLEASIAKTAAPAVKGTTIQFKRGNKVNLPSSAAVGEPLVTLDTGELYVGTGTGLRKISDVVVSETEPAVEDRNKLWFSPTENVTRIFKDGTWQISISEASQDYGAF